MELTNTLNMLYNYYINGGYMSLYIGKDINNEPLLHLTSDQRTEQELKSDVPIPSTLFHSNLPYISVVDIFGEGPLNYAELCYPYCILIIEDLQIWASQ